MKVSQVKAILSDMDDNLDVAIEQIFNEHRSIELRSIEVVNNCVIFKDHYVRVSQHSIFRSFDGNEFTVPVLPERMLNNAIRRV